MSLPVDMNTQAIAVVAKLRRHIEGCIGWNLRKIILSGKPFIQTIITSESEP